MLNPWSRCFVEDYRPLCQFSSAEEAESQREAYSLTDEVRTFGSLFACVYVYVCVCVGERGTWRLGL